jgi:hypothetical protein
VQHALPHLAVGQGVGGVAEVRAQVVQRRRRAEQLHVAGRRQRQVRVQREQRVAAVERDDHHAEARVAPGGAALEGALQVRRQLGHLPARAGRARPAPPAPRRAPGHGAAAGAGAWPEAAPRAATRRKAGRIAQHGAAGGQGQMHRPSHWVLGSGVNGSPLSRRDGASVAQAPSGRRAAGRCARRPPPVYPAASISDRSGVSAGSGAGRGASRWRSRSAPRRSERPGPRVAAAFSLVPRSPLPVGPRSVDRPARTLPLPVACRPGLSAAACARILSRIPSGRKGHG